MTVSPEQALEFIKGLPEDDATMVALLAGYSKAYLNWLIDPPVCDICGEDKTEAEKCEGCSEIGCYCIVTPRNYPCGDLADGELLCDECAPNHRGCPDCDPPDREDY